MKAALWYEKKDVRVEEIEEPKVVEGSVKIKVKWCGICGSDLHEYLGGPIFIPVGQPHALSGTIAPVVLGHEFSGEIVELGQGVTKFNIGDRVIVEPIVACGKCSACMEGKYNLCSSLGFHGLCGSGGGLAEYTVFPEEFVHKIPDEMSYEDAALVEPMAVALHSVRIANFNTGDTALVLGAGPIGLATIECLKAAGARLVVVLQRKSIRQKYAKRAGADVVLDPNEVNIPEEVKKLTDGLGVDVAFETTGAKIGFDTGIESLKFEGTMVITSIWEKDTSFNPNVLVFTEKKIVGTLAYRHEFPATMALMKDGRIKTDGYITKKIALDDIVEEGFGALTGPEKKKHVKIIVTPDKSLL
ncbi:2,3-butanediol dehydrogenase [Clostridium botulinum]|uniref:2,3-butanediol dehydrogenase n=1 Tax=Clostridium botulinum TaxID=1491 RepID=A0A6G4EFL0_CLOBO|nr:2,3-butanediol dehydrogenase [Clostridium botulinum]APH17758.1 zinc-binding dehydrogenase family protein [Clostridium botulinum]AUM91808.1 butanediol dehydrogenase [Clostridium botulinum]NFB13217.1 2,3-butanediol dehydrogenase [Clostridium botulinum]NFH57247.1 2,3-butanediol dehydrogenase [Clostridium botulinum]NFH62031.1 2,3-butanediol dehydrogenase [Clostridium botulinum]